MSRKLQRLIKGKNRGNNLIPLFKKYLINIENSSILDVGCGFGSLTVDFAKKFKFVHSIDGADKEIKITQKRVKDEKLENVNVFKDNALNIKTVNQKFEVIHLSGVFEWLRYGNLKKSASYNQKLFLKNIGLYLKDDSSILYSSTENRFFPYYSLRDPHNDNWPIMVLLNQKFADFLMLLFKNKKYVAKIYSYWGLKKMFLNYYGKVDFYVPIPHYQYVYGFANINDRKKLIQECKRILREFKLDNMQKFTVKWILWTSRFGLIKFLTPGFITVAQKHLNK